MAETEKTSKFSQRLKPVGPIAGKNFKVKCLPKKVHPPIELSNRPPWNDDVMIRPGSNRFEKIISCKTYDIEVPCPDYTCFKGSRYKYVGGQPVPDGDVVLMRKNYKPTPWCDPMRRLRQVRRCAEYVCGKYKEVEEDLPSNYQQAYLNKGKAREIVQCQSTGQTAHPIYIPVDHKQEAKIDNESTGVFYTINKAKIDEASKNNSEQAYKRLDCCAFQSG